MISRTNKKDESVMLQHGRLPVAGRKNSKISEHEQIIIPLKKFYVF